MRQAVAIIAAVIIAAAAAGFGLFIHELGAFINDIGDPYE